MSFFDDASLVMIPSGYKNQKVYSVKPLDGSGDLTFSRASNATRVASNGLIEKVRTNLLTYSNTFSDAAWVTGTGTKPTTTQNVTDPFGVASNAWTITGAGTAFSRLLRLGITLTTAPQTLSFFVKKGTATTVTIFTAQTSVADFTFNFDTQAITGDDGGYNVIRKATALSNGWFRLSMTLSTTSGTASESWGFSLDGSITTTFLLFGAQLEAGDIATDYIPTTTAAVSVGPVSGLPRLDYLDSTCPRLLLEPQRTNLFNFSEQFNNAYWSKDLGVSVAANVAISPDGYTNADRVSYTSAGTSIYSIVSGISTAHQFSVYLKAEGANIGKQINLESSVNINVTLTGEWQRFVTTSNDGVVAIKRLLVGQADAVLVWGAQFEAGAYATSYIPTLGASVTRVADAASKTGISSLIGQTEGTVFLYADIQKHNDADFYIAISDGASLGDAVYLYQPASGNLQVLIRKTGNADSTITVLSANWIAGLNKLAIAYTATTIEVFINGVSKGSTTFTALPTLSQFTIGSRPDVVGTLVGTGGYNQALLFKTRLSNSDLATLTTL